MIIIMDNGTGNFDISVGTEAVVANAFISVNITPSDYSDADETFFGTTDLVFLGIYAMSLYAFAWVGDRLDVLQMLPMTLLAGCYWRKLR